MNALTKKTRLLLAALLAVITISTLFYIYKTNQKQPQPTQNDQVTEVATEQDQNAVVEIQNEKGETKQYSLKPEVDEKASNLLSRLAAADKAFTFETKQYSFGMMIVSINGYTPDSTKEFWSFIVNGQDSMVGISDYTVKPKDNLTFKIQKLQ